MDTYEKEYKDLLKRLKNAKEDDDFNDERYCCVIDEIVPELAESEDKEMKNWILDELRLSYQWAAGDRDRCEELLKAIAWLEKRGKSKWTEEDDTIRCEIIRRMEALDHYWNRPNDQKLIDWLKSLKQRMEEQQ